MKTVSKKFSLAGLGAACLLTLSLGAGIAAHNSFVANAEDVNGAPDASSFFYDYMLDADNNEYTLAKKFYKALEQMNESGDFKDGVVDYEISSIVTSAQLKGWIEDGDLEVPRAFSAARDAFLTDHPEIFYINFYKLTISVAKSGGAYVGYINSGREANLYYENGLNTPNAVAEAIQKFENRITEVVGIVNKAEENNNYVARDVFLAKEVNTYLAKNITYDYVAYENMDDPNYVAASYINSAYGGLVEGKAVCGGYSNAYKVIMDRLGIPCITVNGYSNNKDENGSNSGTSVAHMWNYVWLANPATDAVQSKSRVSSTAASSRATESAGEWYSVDVTWNSSSYSLTRYAVLSESVDAELHVTDGVISSSGYRLRYPALSSHTYGGTTDTDGLQLTITYEQASGEDNNGGILYNSFFHFSYNGKDAKRLLEEDGHYMAVRYAYYYPEDGQLEIKWTPWYAVEYWRQALVNFNGGSENDEDMIQNTGSETRIYGNTSEYYVQVAVFDAAPTIDPAGGHDPETEYLYFYCYSDEVVEKTTAVAVSDVAENLTYGTYTPPPYIVYDQTVEDRYTAIRAISDSMHRSGSNLMDEKNAFTLTVKYDQDLHIIDDSKPIGISFTSVHPNTQQYAFFVAFEDGKYVHLLEDNRTLEFKFCPSLMYEHNSEDYHFFFTNVGSNELVKIKDENGNLVDGVSNKLPNSALYCFERVYMACPKVFNYDGRLWVDCCAQPELICNSDLSAMDFLDEKGESTFSENQRSQMMLVAERSDTSTVNAMKDEIDANGDINVGSNDIISSETYDIYLSMCNQTPVIPNGSYVKLSLGFPEGYGPDDEGVTFKIYHRKYVKETDSYIIEEVPCVVTMFGIVVVCTSFSPYMVAVVDAEFANTKNVYASIEGNGGKLTVEDGKIRTLNEGDSYTYTIQPDAGYQIYTVTLNGEVVTDRVRNGQLTLTYAELAANNQLVIQYIADEAAARIQTKIDNNVIDEQVVIDVTQYVVAVEDQPVYSNAPLNINYIPGASGEAEPPAGPNVAAIVISVVCVAVAVAAAVAIAVVVVRKKKTTDDEEE